MRISSASAVGDISIPRSYLGGAFIVQSGRSENDVCIADGGVSCDITHDGTRLY